MKILAALLASTFLFTASAFSQERICIPLDQLKAQLAQQQAPIAGFVALTPEQTSIVVAWFNAQPPESSDDFNFATVFRLQDGRIGLMVGNDGNVCASFLIPNELVPSLLKALAGGQA